MTTVILLCVEGMVNHAYGAGLPEAAVVEGRVSKVIDGDTFDLRVQQGQDVRVRVSQVDAPERGQAYGANATNTLKQLIERKHVRIVVETTDGYGRVVAQVFAADVDVARQLVNSGDVWVYRRYLRDRSLLDLEKRARDARLGLWAQSDPTAPWEWRQRDRSSDDVNCRIKGNINTRGVKIYHLPGSKYYAATRISRSQGSDGFVQPRKPAQLAGGLLAAVRR